MIGLDKFHTGKQRQANLFCLLPGKGPFEAGLRQRLGLVFSGAPVEYCQDLTGLFARLRQRAYCSESVVLLETNLELLDQLVAQRDLFAEVPLVLLVPDEKMSTLTKGHLLRPRFMTSPEGDPELIKEVLANILKRSQKENRAADQR
jgi:hypothetical protein